jgi:DNA polymerase V
MSDYCSRAAEKLRHQHSVTGCITVFIRTSPFNLKEAQYQRTASIKLETATQDTRTIITTANRLLKEIFRQGYAYQKCGVQLSNIQPDTQPSQLGLFAATDNDLPTESRQLQRLGLIKTGNRKQNGLHRTIRPTGKNWLVLNVNHVFLDVNFENQ